MNDAWYEVVSAETRITQGDLISGCPITTWGEIAELSTDNFVKSLESAMQASLADVVVMSQACDLEHDKVSSVVLCPHLALSEFKNAWSTQQAQAKQNPTAKAWQSLVRSIRDGSTWNLSLLNEATSEELVMEHRIVNFHEIFSVPRQFIEAFCRHSGSKRLRLRPPYREHLSQAFARFFMRVGLPIPISGL